ncbi:MAG: glycyl-radical enzyme activating protein [Syntrophothermus sp.]
MNDVTGIVFNIQKFSLNDGPGIRTTVFLKGCPLSCIWCHNPESWNPLPEKTSFRLKAYSEDNDSKFAGYKISVTKVLKEICKDSMFYEESSGGVTFSGGEPLMQPDFLKELLINVKKYEIHTAIDTCGYAPFEQFEKVIPYTDLFLFDLKIMDNDLHRKFTGVNNGIIHENLKRLNDCGAPIFIRIPLIPEITDTTENLESIAAFLTRLKQVRKVALLPYNETGISKYRKLQLSYKPGNLSTQSSDKLDDCCNIFKDKGFEVKIRG